MGMKNSNTRKAKKGLTVLAFIVLPALALCCGAVAWLTRGQEAFAFPSATVEFVNPRTFAADPKGNLVATDSGERRILGMTPDGTLRFTIEGEQRDGGFYSGRLAGFDSLGRFYVDDTVLDIATSNTAARRVLRYAGDGRFLGAIVSYAYEGEAMGDWERQPVFVRIFDDVLYWFLLDGEETWTLRSKPLLTEGAERSVRLTGVDVYACLDAVPVSPSEAYFLTPEGTILFATADGNIETVFPAAGERAMLFPTAISMDSRGRLLAVDGKRTVISLTTDVEPVVTSLVLDPDSARRAGYPAKLAFMDLRSDGDGAIRVANEYTADLLTFPSAGGVSVISSARLTPSAQAASLASFAAAWAAVAALLAATVLLYRRLFIFMAPLVLKQLAIFVPLITVMTVIVAVLVYAVASEPLETSIKQRLQHLAQIGAGAIAPADIDALRFEGRSLSEIKGSPAFSRILRTVDSLVNENKDPWNSGVFDYIYKKDGDSWWVLGSFDYIELYPYVKDEFERVLKTGEPAYLRYSDIYGAWLSAFSPILGADGKPAAVLEATVSADILDEANRAFVRRSIEGGLVIIVGFLAAFAVFTAILLRSIRSMKSGAERIAGGDYGIDIEVRSRDEIEDLGNAFNSMSREIRDYIERITALNEANARFVPSAFLSHLGKTDITQIKLGDQAKADMTILFTDIRSFTDFSESMTPVEVFSFLNDYLRRMGPEIRERGGFIDKYIGDAIMALFPGTSEAAFEAVYGMFARLEELNSQRIASGKKAVDMGIGLHRGPLMIGIIGEEKRFDGTVISDAVNLASRLESLTKYYGTRCIVSESIRNSLGNPDAYPSRFLDAVRVKGRKEVVRIRELLVPGDPDSEAKLRCVPAWEAAWLRYEAGRFDEALALYETILKDYPGDGAAALFRDRCLRLIGTAPGADWDGVTTFGQK